MKTTHSRHLGFTLIELLVVVAIIVLLTTIGVVSYAQTNKKARDGKRKADLEQIRSALVLYRTDNGDYPADIDWDDMAPIQSYISGVTISDPLPEPHTQYTYAVGGGGSTFQICATLEATTPSSYCLDNP
jgi:prepilin-type N-terminal cleavage/methylation domain-containing protein